MNKQTYFYLATLTMLSCSTAFASDNSFNGFYAGVEGGAGLGYFSESTDTTITVDPRRGAGVNADISADTHASNLSGFFGAHLGLGHVFNRFYLGVEGNGDLGEVNTSTYAPPSNQAADLAISIKDKASIQNNYGVTLRPGFLITPTLMLYAQLGAERAKVSMSSDTIFSNSLTGDGGSYTLPSSNTQNEWGYRAGIGIEKKTSQHWSVRAEYLFTSFGSLSASNEVPIDSRLILPTSNISEKTDVSPYMHSVMLGVTYYV